MKRAAKSMTELNTHSIQTSRALHARPLTSSSPAVYQAVPEGGGLDASPFGGQQAFRSSSTALFFIIAFALTWGMDLPMVVALLKQESPAPVAFLLGGFGSLGPALAALLLTLGNREAMRGVFGRWRTNPIWILVGLLSSAALHLPATLIEVGLGGEPAQWFYPPVRPEHFAAMVMFSFGEEFGWRGYAYPRLASRYGPVVGCLILGTLWTLWHVGMWTTSEGPPGLLQLGLGVVEFSAASLVFAWVFEKSNRSIAVAIALHASAHLDNVFRAPESELRLRLLRLAVLVIVAAFAARSLMVRYRNSVPQPTSVSVPPT